MAAFTYPAASSPNIQGSWPPNSPEEWLRNRPWKAAICIQRQNSSGVGWPRKPPASDPAKEMPEAARRWHWKLASFKCSQLERLSPVQVAEKRCNPANPDRESRKGLLPGAWRFIASREASAIH